MNSGDVTPHRPESAELKPGMEHCVSDARQAGISPLWVTNGGKGKRGPASGPRPSADIAGTSGLFGQGSTAPILRWAVRSGLPSTSEVAGHHSEGREGPIADDPRLTP